MSEQTPNRPLPSAWEPLTPAEMRVLQILIRDQTASDLPSTRDLSLQGGSKFVPAEMVSAVMSLARRVLIHNTGDGWRVLPIGRTAYQLAERFSQDAEMVRTLDGQAPRLCWDKVTTEALYAEFDALTEAIRRRQDRRCAIQMELLRRAEKERG